MARCLLSTHVIAAAHDVRGEFLLFFLNRYPIFAFLRYLLTLVFRFNGRRIIRKPPFPFFCSSKCSLLNRLICILSPSILDVAFGDDVELSVSATIVFPSGL